MELSYITVGFGSFIGCFHVRPPLLLRNILIIGVRTFINPGWNQEIVLQCTNCSAASQARNQSRLTATKKKQFKHFRPNPDVDSTLSIVMIIIIIIISIIIIIVTS